MVLQMKLEEVFEKLEAVRAARGFIPFKKLSLGQLEEMRKVSRRMRDKKIKFHSDAVVEYDDDWITVIKREKLWGVFDNYGRVDWFTEKPIKIIVS